MPSLHEEARAESLNYAGGFACRPSRCRLPGRPTPGTSFALRLSIAPTGGSGILTGLPSAALLSLALGADSPCSDERRAGNLGFTASGLFTRFIVTHVSIRTSASSSSLLKPPSSAGGTLPYHSTCVESVLSVIALAPLHLPRMRTRSVSYYAFFEGWLLLSQLPDCLSLHTSFSTRAILGTLNDGLG